MMSSKIDRRDVLRGAAAIPLAAAVAQAANMPLSVEELRLLAMSATPSERLADADAYNRTRVFREDDGQSRQLDIIEDMERRGLVTRRPNYHPDYDCEFVVEATESGIAELRKAGVLS